MGDGISGLVISRTPDGCRRLGRDRSVLAVDRQLTPVARAMVQDAPRRYELRELDPDSLTPAMLVEESQAIGAALVVVRAAFDHRFLVSVDDAATRAGLPWLAFHLDGATGWFGPAFDPGHTPTFDDLMSRPVYGEPYIPPDPDLFWMLGVLLSDLDRWHDGRPMRSWWHEVELDSRLPTIRRHPVLPLPPYD